MKHIKLLSKYGIKLALTDRGNSNLILSNKKKKEKTGQTINKEDIFYSNKSFNAIKSSQLNQPKQNRVLKFKTHQPIRKPKPLHRPDLSISKTPFSSNSNNHAIDYNKSLLKTKPRIAKVKPKTNYILSHNFEIEHPNFIKMKLMIPRTNLWLNKNQINSVTNNKDQNTYSQSSSIDKSRDFRKTVSFPLSKVSKEIPRQICHTPRIEAITPRIKGTIDFDISNKKTKTRIDHNSLRYQFFDSKQNPEYIDYSLDCIAKHKLYADFGSLADRTNDKISLPLFMCKIFSGNGHSYMTDKSLQLSHFSDGPLSYLDNNLFTSSNKQYKPKTDRLSTLSKEHNFTNVKSKKFRKYLKYISKRKEYYFKKL